VPNGILSVNGFVPDRIIDNHTIARWAQIPEDWIEERTGIRERRYADARTATSDLAAEAAAPLVADAGTRDAIGAMVVATTTPDQPQPATAVFVQEKLGLREVPAFDLNAVCSGFLYALSVADALLSAHPSWGNALVVAADKYSDIMDRSDRRTVSLFGDGAGAALIGPVPNGYGIRGIALLADGQAASYVRVPGGGSRHPVTMAAGEDDYYFRMDGRAVREWALQYVPKTVDQALNDAGLELGQIDRVIFHQGNARLVATLADRLGIPESRVALTADLYGNTAAASIPLTLHNAHTASPIQRGENIMLASVGGGMTAGAAVLTWY
jgi:3-oxoacyl-(acyl-carrier-protein) synthase III